MKKVKDSDFENNILNQLRHEAVKWICVLDDTMCKSYINPIVQWHLTDPVNKKYVFLLISYIKYH